MRVGQSRVRLHPAPIPGPVVALASFGTTQLAH